MNPLDTLDNELRRLAGIFTELANSRHRIASLQLTPERKMPEDILQSLRQAVVAAEGGAVSGNGYAAGGGDYYKLRPIQAAFRFVRDHGEGLAVKHVQDECVKRGMKLKQARSFRTSLSMPDARRLFKREKDGRTIWQGKLYFTEEAKQMVARGDEA